MSVAAGVVGAAGFAGIELVGLILRHPEFHLVAATSDELAGKRIDEVYPALTGISEDMSFVAHNDPSLLECDVVFLAVPHTAALAQAGALLKHGITVIDLSADFRLKDPAVYEQWYGAKHTETALLAEAAFGLPELFRDQLKEAACKYAATGSVLVGCAGCYPTATSLAAAPALKAGIVAEGLIVADAVSGVSGAGRKPTLRTHFCFANENVEAYNVGKHRHTPEIEQILGIDHRLVFTPHLAPYDRGLLSTVTLPTGDREFAQDELDELYTDFYKHDPFVMVLTGGAQPKTSSVAGTNFAHVAAVYNAYAHAIVATCAIDNIGKGAAGQAMQCANLVCGFSETAGLLACALLA